jgi:hypothetical protein
VPPAKRWANGNDNVVAHRFPDHRPGENYSLQHSGAHKRSYYPNMTKDDCLVFKVYGKEDGPRFVFHTAFEDARPHIELRSMQIHPPRARPLPHRHSPRSSF